MRYCFYVVIIFFCLTWSQIKLRAESQVLDLWPENQIPGPAAVVDGDERDLTKVDDKLIDGERIIKLGHVSKPPVHVYLPPSDKANGAAVVICPGGGFSILARDRARDDLCRWSWQHGRS